MVGINKKTKLFNKVFREFLDEYRTLTGENVIVKKIKSSDVIMKYFSEVNERLQAFINCDNSIIPEISLLKGIDAEKYKINWEYLHNLYFITLPQANPELVQKSKDAIALSKSESSEINIMALKGMVDNPETQNLNSLINEIAQQITGSLKDVDLSKIDPTELMTNLMAGKNQACGIDFTSIIETTTKDIHSKIDKGQLDLNNLKNSAEALLENLGVSSKKPQE